MDKVLKTKNVETFEKELNYIKDEKIRWITKCCLYDAPDYFFEIPASSTGKFHPDYALGEGGLVRHVKAACKMLHDFIKLEFFKCTDEEHDYSIAALILHDCRKSGVNHGQYTVHEHPVLAADLVRDTCDALICENEAFGDTATGIAINEYYKNVPHLIESHMGQWNWSKRSSIKLPKPKTTMEFLVHLADYLASRKYLEVKL